MSTSAKHRNEPAVDGPPPSQIKRRTFLLSLGALGVAGGVGSWIKSRHPDSLGLSFATPLRVPPLLESEMIDGERVFHLNAQAGVTKPVPGVSFPTMGFNGPHLGPTLRAARGEKLRIHVTNDLKLPITAHWHGMLLPASQDGTAH